jgi:hypothetical protein
MPSNSVLRNGLPSTLCTRVAWIALKLSIAVALGFAVSVSSSGQALAGGSWNDEGIKWRGYEDGLKEAKSSARPICLIYYTEWCPHCSTYSRVFSDPKVVEKSKSFVMIRLDRDKNRELSKQHAPDGEYIPRTYFLSQDGKLVPELHAPREKYLYFYDENSADSILTGMDAALKKLTSPPAKEPKTAAP